MAVRIKHQNLDKLVDELKCVRDHRNEIESLTSTSAAGSAKYFVIVDGFSGIRKNVIGYSSTINVRNKFGASPPIQEDVTVTDYEKTGLLVSKSNFLLLLCTSKPGFSRHVTILHYSQMVKIVNKSQNKIQKLKQKAKPIFNAKKKSQNL